MKNINEFIVIKQINEKNKITQGYKLIYIDKYTKVAII